MSPGASRKEEIVKRVYTKRAMEKTVMFHASKRDVELLRLAASRQEISRGDFIRQAIKEKAARDLASVENAAPLVESLQP